MKFIKRFVSFFTASIFCLHLVGCFEITKIPLPNPSQEDETSNYQSVQKADDDITLVVSGNGNSKEEATKSALLSAIEQAYGTFVSANTTILNDSLVKDEIVTVSTGNIKGYKYLDESVQDGKTSVTIETIVSIGKLISYSQSKGSKAVFSGNAFAMNIKMKELHQKNAAEAYKNMCVQVQKLAENAFDYSIELGEPTYARYYLNQWGKRYHNSDRINARYPEGVEDEPVYNFNNSREGYQIPIRIKITTNNTTAQIYNIVCNTLDALSMTITEYVEYKKQNLDYWCTFYSYKGWEGDNGEKDFREIGDIYLPFSYDSVKKRHVYMVADLFRSYLGFRVYNVAKPNEYYGWKRGVNNNDKLATFSSSKEGPNYNDSNGYYDCWNSPRDASLNDFFFYNSHNEIIDCMDVGVITQEFGAFYNGCNSIFYHDRFFIWPMEPGNSNPSPFDKWSTPNNEIVSYTIPVFIPKEEMNTFQGFEIKPYKQSFTMYYE